MADNGNSSLEDADCPAGNVVLPVLTSVASIIGCFYIVGTYWRVRALRHHPAGIMFGMSVYGAIYQFLYLLDKSFINVQCNDMGIVVDFFLTGQETYMLIFAIDLLLALKNPFSAAKGQMTKYHIFGGVWSLICAVISHYDTHYALFGFCWMDSSDEILNRPRSEEGGNGTLTTGVFFAFYIAVVYCTSLIAIVRTWNTFKKGLPDTFATRRRTQRHLKYYVGCYFGYWTMVLACYALFSLLPTNPDNNGGFRCRVWNLLSCLLLAKGMVHAIIWTRTSNILKIIEQLREFGSIDLPEHDDNINWALRREILTNTTKGICESVDRAERQARASAASSFRSISASGASMEEGIESSSVQKEYCDRKESFAQIEEVILESQNDHNRDGVVFKDFAPHVFRRLREQAKISSARYRNSLNQTTMERVSEGKSGAFFYFTEDRKYVVKTLTNEELKFLLSILPQYYTFMKTHPDTFMTRFFGCHGLTMYGKTVFFVVMQSVFASSLQIHERFDLKGSWVGRIEGRKPTGTIAICKYCSAEYRVGSHDQHCNVRGGVLRHQYDQTGKDLNWNRHMALPISTARAVAMQLTIDSDFLCSINCIDYSLLVGIHHRSFNVSHFSSADTFDPRPIVRHESSCSGNSDSCRCRGSNRSSRSQSHGSSNNSYSFSTNASFVRQRSSSGGNPIGRVCYNSGGGGAAIKPFHRVGGGMSVDEVHGPGLYYLGLIDILQQWNLRKRVEHFIRVYIMMQDRHGISVVNPRQYAERFQQRVITELIYDAASAPARELVDDISLTQLRRQNQRNAELVESGRTMSTMLASREGSASAATIAKSPRTDRLFNSTLSPRAGDTVSTSPFTPPLSATPKADAMSAGSRYRVSCSWDSRNSGCGIGRLSGGFVMEIPGASPAYPTTLDTLPLHIRRSLAPLTPSSRTSSVYRRDSEYSKVSSSDGMASSNSRSSISGRQRDICSTGGSNSHSGSSSDVVIHLEDGAPSPLDYRIVSTPTFPDRSGNATRTA